MFVKFTEMFVPTPPLQVIPLESVMKNPKDMPVVLDFAAVIVVVVNLPFALYGYLLFGDQIQGMPRVGWCELRTLTLLWGHLIICLECA